MTEHLKDLRGVEYRSVHRDDALIISGAEYLRKGHALLNAEIDRDRFAGALKTIAALDKCVPVDAASHIAREVLATAFIADLLTDALGEGRWDPR